MRKVTVNGETREVRDGATLSDLIADLELPDSRIAVELNKSVVRRNDWPDILISDRDVVEIVHFVGGG